MELHYHTNVVEISSFVPNSKTRYEDPGAGTGPPSSAVFA
jgi:hypothetical protein